MRIAIIHADNPHPWTGTGNNTYLLSGRDATLVDAGQGVPSHVEAVAEAAGDLPLARVLVTHGHVDHAGGAPALAARFSGASFHKVPWPERDGRYPVPWQPLRDGEVLDAGGTGLLVLHTPGHSPDHACFFEPKSGVLFAGDLVMNGGTVVIPPSHGGNLRLYLQSLRTLLDLQPRRILPAHGAPIENPGALVRSYLAHRAMRERQIVDALAAGPLTVDDLVAKLYQGLAEDLRGAAGESVLAHLQKLEEEGGACAEHDGGHLRWRRA